MTKAVAEQMKVQQFLRDGTLIPETAPSQGLAKMYASGWYDHIQNLLRASWRIADHLRREESVLVHCSDGWDRTAQLTALASLLIDKEYRSLEGFLKLIEKEFCWMGHKFATRLGHCDKSDTSQRSPIFLQFLECVHIILNFEGDGWLGFDRHVLVILAEASELSQLFGDFRFDCEQAREAYWSANGPWRSLFRELLKSQKNWCKKEWGAQGGSFVPDVRDFPIWREFWYRWDGYRY